MNATAKINSNYDNNDNYDVPINIPLARHHLERDLNNAFFPSPDDTIVKEPEMAKIFINEDSASRKSKRQDEKGKDDDVDNEKNEDEGSTDESDGPKKKLCFVQIDEEASNVEDVEIEEIEPKKVNSYAAKKTVAQGMMDIALITANANQLRFIVEFNRNSSTFYFIIALIVLSLFLQVGVGMALIFKGRLDIKGKSKDPDAKRINNYVVVAIFLVTIINVFIASFTITGNGEKTH